MLVLPSPYFFASFLPPPHVFLAVSPSSLNRSSPLRKIENNSDCPFGLVGILALQSVHEHVQRSDYCTYNLIILLSVL